MFPIVASGLAWDLWFVSWGIAALWTARTRGVAKGQYAHWIPTIAGFLILIYGTNALQGPLHYWAIQPLWYLPFSAGWALTGVCIAGLAFTWWARIYLGRLWSNTITRKEDHHIVDTGPYGLVRHPIYTGLIAAAFAMAVQAGNLMSLAGATLIAIGFWTKARIEERFLREQLGAENYDGYAARVPMLVPFWPMGGR